MGPLGKVWKALDEGRGSGDDRMVRVKDILSLTEQTIVLLRQANIAAQYARRLEVMMALAEVSEPMMHGKSYRNTITFAWTETNYFARSSRRKWRNT